MKNLSAVLISAALCLALSARASESCLLRVVNAVEQVENYGPRAISNSSANSAGALADSC